HTITPSFPTRRSSDLFSGLLIAAPIWGSQNFPVQAKIGLAFFFALLMTPLIPALGDTLPSDPIPFSFIALGELAIGLMIGFVMRDRKSTRLHSSHVKN